MGRARAVSLLIVIVLAAPAVLMVVADEAQAQKASDPWWGPSSPSRPTDGWAVRIPFTITNEQPYVRSNHPVGVEVDFNQVLIQAGWTAQTVGSESRLRGFTLDVDSIRVVEYARGFASGPINGPDTQPTPHVFYPAAFSASGGRDFDPERNPVGTVMVLVDNIGAAKTQTGTKYYYLYANPLEYRATPPAVFERERLAPLDTFLWSTTGTTFYGFVPQQGNQNHRIEINSVQSSVPTTVTVYQYSLGKYQPVVSTSQFPNPMTLTGFGFNSMASTFVPAGSAYKIVSDHPIRVAAHGQPTTGTPGFATAIGNHLAQGFAPSTSNSFAGSSFVVMGFASDGLTSMGTIKVVKATQGGTLRVTAQSQQPTTLDLSDANPVGFLSIPNTWTLLTVSPPTQRVLISHTVSTNGPFIAHPVPALNGGVYGTRFYADVPPQGGFASVCVSAPVTLRVFDISDSARQVYPPGPIATTPAARLATTPSCTKLVTNAAWPQTATTEFLSSVESSDPIVGGPNAFRLTVGADGERPKNVPDRGYIGPFAGHRATDFHASGNAIGLFGHYNNTKVTIVEERLSGPSVNTTISLRRDEYRPWQPSAPVSGSALRYHIVSTKPIGVNSIEPLPDSGGVVSYGHYLAGRPTELPVALGLAEVRGPLIELRAVDTTARQIFRTTGPATATSFQLEAVNLGRWIGGDNLPDTLSISCSGTPLGWEVVDCDREIRLDSRATQRFEVTITPSVDDVDKTRTILVTARSGASNLTVTMKLIVHVEIRYGLGMWFDVEGGRKTIDPPLGLDPGETHRYAIVVKNTGSSDDRYRFEVESPREGWVQRLTRGAEPVTEPLDLAAGESIILSFFVTAPSTETAQQNIVRITGQSLKSSTASDLVNTQTRIRPKIDVRLTLDPTTQIAAPDEVAKFNLTVLNRGNDIFRITLREDSILPPGWVGELTVKEIDLGPGQPFTFPLFVTPPKGSLAGDLATLKVTAETDTGDGTGTIPGDQVSAVVVVRKIHNITTPDLSISSVDAGVDFEYVLPIKNSGNGDETIEILPGASTPPWRLVTNSSSSFLARDAEAELAFSVEVPAGTPPGDYNYTFVTRLSREAVQNITIPLRVVETSRVSFEGIGAVDLIPGQSRRIAASIANVGNVPITAELTAEVPPGWNVSFFPHNVTLESGARTPLTIVMNASRDVEDGAYEVVLQSTAESGVSGALEVPVRVARPDLFIEKVQTGSKPRSGDILLVTATVGNRGGTAAENVTVALIVDGQAVDQVRIARISVGDTKLATLSWVATHTPDNVAVSIDPENEIVETSRDENAAEVVFGSRLGIPWPGFVAVALTLSFMAVALRRRNA